MEWRVSGRYFEACSCEAVCPCRRVGGRAGGRSTYGVCDFALGWSIDSGMADHLDLSGFEVVMAGSYDDDEPGSPWRVVLYVDARATAEQQEAMEAIYLGRAGGTTLTNFAAAIGECLPSVLPASRSTTRAANGASVPTTTSWSSKERRSSPTRPSPAAFPATTILARKSLPNCSQSATRDSGSRFAAAAASPLGTTTAQTPEVGPAARCRFG